MTAPANWQNCHTPHKVKFLDRAGAEGHIRRTERPGDQPRQPYRCACGFWHVTTKRVRKEKP